ncbi:hypothetical protein [Dickeya dianthicola]|uniref:hypothetical protein n=1 Tax=Dickeya dianthicola TaxID=204039 RepID=UPI00131A0737|nr:hypothetical protein [Dickeya dianthicola]QVH37144.1 hypothetical protein JRZ93_15995 [Dickeya dianthicola]QVH41342.1 hypothetical protein JRZ83_16005 [Dickeya dianthicola]QVH45542.1 hypothetical protein JRZ88_16010 [Dickeya dianthicola]QVH49742.1 hypothetical protein JRZ86_16005 [Dickeya dianthicola]QVH53944.1 hypothetical protein JRZ87_15990 [Dickeya dianthicola]
MEQKLLYLWIAIAFLVGAIIQKMFFGGSFSFGLLSFAAVFAWCSYKEKISK